MNNGQPSEKLNNDKKYYPDRLSLIKNSPEELVTYSKRIINQNAINALYRFATFNPIQFRRLWLLFMYQDYRIEDNFAAGKSIVKKYIAQRALGSRSDSIAPNRRQILGALRQQKIKEFIAWYSYLTNSYGQKVNIFEFAVNAPIDQLLQAPPQIDFNSDEPTPTLMFESIIGKQYKLPKELWSIILNPSTTIEQFEELYIPLPRAEGYDLSAELSRYLPYDDTPIPFDLIFESSKELELVISKLEA